ncbi:MAG TPA: bifunctional metallophosphatase/5'-nucleotidase [Allosphingosinicella sp.]|nr:bifunctional metallophosphatase/5'-nucleotidase [Allosphingosinicella sp.]
MTMRLAAALLLLAAGGCATTAPPAGAPVEVKIIAFNDFHGNLEPPKQSVDAPRREEGSTRVPAGGAAYLASAIGQLRSANPNNVVVSAGDMIGASPLVSAVFLDEPTIHAMNRIGVDFNAVGNHEFDKGREELLRMQKGGCDKHTARQPCAVEPFPGARFGFLAANVVTENGSNLFPAYGLRSFGRGRGRIRIGFIGLTLKETPTLVTPAGVAGLAFADEAQTINALVPKLRREGADAIVVLIHQGLSTKVGYNDKGCEGVDGDLLPILARLDPAVDLVVSGHTHNAYVCDHGRIDPARPFLVTSAGRYGTLVTDIALTIDPAAGRVTAKRADNVIVQSEGYGNVAASDRFPRYAPDPAVAALVRRYAERAGPLANRVVGRVTAPATRALTADREMVLGDLIADAQLAATRASGAQIAFTNGFGVRADLQPAADGSVTFGQLFAIQPFGNTLVVKSLTGRQIRALLEQQFDSGSNTVTAPNMLLPSANVRYAYDLSRPAGQRILDLRIDGAPVDDDAVYRVAMNSFLATGGDNFTIFAEGSDPTGGPLDLDALEAWIASSSPLAPPAPERIRDVTPKP